MTEPKSTASTEPLATPLAELPFTLADLRAAYRGGLAPAEVMAEALARIGRADDPGIFLHVADEAALMAEADALGRPDPSRPLWGIPFAVKDNIDVAGMPTTAACPAWRCVAERDAFAVARLRGAGAIPIGKTNLDQFATGLVGTRTPYPVPRNALDPALVPGGSSSGSAVAVAHGIVPFALGTDTAGSGRVPAALNGIVGLKPTLGAVSTSGVVPACRTLDTVSVFALGVADAWAAYEAAAGYDPADPHARPFPPPALSAPLPAPRIVVPDAAGRRFFGDAAAEVAFAAALERLAAAGAEIREIDFAPFHEVAALLYEGAWLAERYVVIGEQLVRAPEAVHPVTRAVIGRAAEMSAADAFRGIYRLAALRRACQALMAGTDLLAVPSIPGPCTRAEDAADPIGPNARLGTYTNFVNLLDLAALTVPVGPRRGALPGSLTLIGPAGSDARLAAEGMRIAGLMPVSPGATGWAAPAAIPAAPGPRADELALAVCGAHMSGLPLNRELTALGARFLRAARTAPCYRLHALAGGPPRRPGLVRAEAGGQAIALEVWALPRASVGAFLAGIPAPLGLGTVALEDGSGVHGFLCESAGLAGATDISHLGGWRAFLAAEAAGAGAATGS